MKEMVYKNYMEKGQEVIEILDEGIYKGFHYAIVSYGTNPCAYVEIPEGHELYNVSNEYELVDIDCGAMFYGNIKCYHDNNMPIFVYSNSKITENHFDVQEVKHGYWISERDPDENSRIQCYHCSICDDDFHYIGAFIATNYCPNCGTRMDGESL